MLESSQHKYSKTRDWGAFLNTIFRQCSSLFSMTRTSGSSFDVIFEADSSVSLSKVNHLLGDTSEPSTVVKCRNVSVVQHYTSQNLNILRIIWFELCANILQALYKSCTSISTMHSDIYNACGFLLVQHYHKLRWYDCNLLCSIFFLL